MNQNDGAYNPKKSIDVIQKDLIEVKRKQLTDDGRIKDLEGKTDIGNVMFRIIIAVIVSTIITMILIAVST